MSAEEAKKNYLGHSGPRRMNCAESIAHAFKNKIPLSDEELKNYKNFGGGRAPEGYCGAIYAAKCLLEKSGSEKAALLPEIFRNIAGSFKCREIRTLKKYHASTVLKKQHRP